MLYLENLEYLENSWQLVRKPRKPIHMVGYPDPSAYCINVGYVSLPLYTENLEYLENLYGILGILGFLVLARGTVQS